MADAAQLQALLRSFPFLSDQPDELLALDDAAVFHVEARDDAACQHQRGLSRRCGTSTPRSRAAAMASG